MNVERLRFHLDNAESVAVAACASYGGSEHAAIAYVDTSGDWKLLHLYIDGSVAPSGLEPVYLYVVPNIRVSSRTAIAGLCESLARRPELKKLYYEIGVQAHSFFVVEGDQCDLVTQKPGDGLSCSTFVAAIFNSVRRPLVNFRSWRCRPEDFLANTRLINMLRSNNQSRRADDLAPHVGRMRISPSEVAGAALEDLLPAAFMTCRLNSGLIKEAMVVTRTTGADLRSSLLCGLQEHVHSSCKDGRFNRVWAACRARAGNLHAAAMEYFRTID
jgi:hypothetical protein